MNKSVFIKTYGCQMNERDSEALAAILSKKNYTIVDNENEADILIFNTCSVRDQAERKAKGKIGILKRLKREKPNIFIGVVGCMAQSLGDKLIREIPIIDFVVGTDQLIQVPEIIEREIERRQKIVTIESADLVKEINSHLKDNKISGFISVMRGCDMYCAYCIVPYVRGRERSRSMNEIVDEAKRLVNDGVKEIMLLGQSISAYGLKELSSLHRDKESPFAELLERLHEIDGLARIRFTSPHPFFFNDTLINAIAKLPKVCKNIHLPLQSGSDKILKKMNRRYTSSLYMEIVNNLKSKIPDMTFSTDIIVGFPGETEEDFQATRNIMNDVGFDNAYIFKYSPREGTVAAKLTDDAPMSVKEERNQILLADLAERTKKHNKKLEGKILEVLVEGTSKRNPEKWSGRTTTNKVVVFELNKKTKPGDIVSIHITRSTSMTLFGEI